MCRPNNSFFLILLFLSLTTQAQNVAHFTKIQDRYQHYFKIDRKAIHLHTNKTVYTSGEHIWFSTYLFNKRTNSMALGKEYIHVDLIDPLGEIITTKTLLYEAGSANGEFFLAPELTSGDYYLQAYTTEMMALNEDDSQVLPLRILNFELPQRPPSITASHLNITVTPESGQLLLGELGSIGVRIRDNHGRPMIPDSIFLVNTVDKKRTPIPINALGTGKTALIPTGSSAYVVKTYWQDRVQITAVPLGKAFGHTLSVKPNLDQKNLWIKVSSKFPGKLDKAEALDLVLHKDGNLLPILLQTDAVSWSDDIMLPFDQLPPGISTLSLLAEGKELIAERLIYNPDTHSSLAPEVLNVNTSKDSLTFWVKPRNSAEVTLNNLSISVLPNNNLAIPTKDKMPTLFQLDAYFDPYTLLSIQELEAKEPRTLAYAINTALMHSIHGRYSWRNILKVKQSQNSKEKRTSAIDGYVVLKKEIKDSLSILLFSHTNQLFETVPLNKQKRFVFRNLDLEEKSKFTLTLLDSKGKTLSAQFFFTLKPDRKSFKYAFKPKNEHDSTTSLSKDSLQLFKKIQKLEEVVVTANKLKFQKLLPKFQGTKIDSTQTGLTTLGKYVSRYGIRTRFIPTSFIDQRRAGTFQHARICRGGVPTSPTLVIPIFPSIIIDGQFSKYFNDFDNILLTDIEEIYHQKTNLGRCASDTFVVFTRPSYRNRPKPNSAKRSREFIAENGYHRPRDFVASNYLTTSSREFQKFGVVSWIPKIATGTGGVVRFKVPDYGQKVLKLQFQGYTEDQKYVSESLVVDLENYD